MSLDTTKTNNLYRVRYAHGTNEYADEIIAPTERHAAQIITHYMYTNNWASGRVLGVQLLERAYS